jgi:hypothetical protein
MKTYYLINNNFQERDIIEGGNEIADRGGLEKPEDDCERQINVSTYL